MRQARILLLVALATLGFDRFLPGRCAGAERLPDSRLGIRTAPLLLLSRADVQADLGMNPEQAAEAEQAITNLYIKARELKGKTGAEAVAARRAIDDLQQRWIVEKLSESQRIRLDQIDLQWEGTSALISRPSMIGSLGLKPEQLVTLKQLAQEGLGRRARGEGAIQAHRWFAGRALEILSEPQKKSWRAMLGKPFQPQLVAAQPKPRAE